MSEGLPGSAGAVVIGGGIVGVATAYELAKAGVRDVLLLEREAGLGLGSTGKCAGGFRHQFSSEVNVRLSLASARLIRSFTEDHGVPLDVHVEGYLFLCRDEATWASHRAAAAMQRHLGAEVDLLDAASCRELIPGLATDDVVGATFGQGDGIADPAGLVGGYATIARRAGVTIRTGVAVEAIRTSSDGSRATAVGTSLGEVRASLVVLAAGVWSRELGRSVGLDLPVEPHARQLVQTTDFKGRPERRTLVIDTSTMAFFHREGSGILMGVPPADDGPTFELATSDRFVAEELIPALIRVLPAVEDASFATTWTGLYEMTPDHHPLIGAVRSIDGLLVATGYSGHGFQHAPITGRLLAEIATTGEAATIDIHALRPERFAEGEPIVEAFVV
jgi:sarcosine oxidase, subunit beta